MGQRLPLIVAHAQRRRDLAAMRHTNGELHASLCDRQNARTSGNTIAAQRS
jgi:hypothetical protein